MNNTPSAKVEIPSFHLKRKAYQAFDVLSNYNDKMFLSTGLSPRNY